MEGWEFALSMIRSMICFFAVFLSVSALAQNPIPAAATAPVTSVSTTEVAQFQKIEDAWANAVNGRDQYGMELVLSPLFVDVSAVGNISTRNQQVADLLGNEDKSMHLDQKVITVRMLGDTAVANGTYILHHKISSGVVDEKGVFTHVFERVRGGWVCINSQRTAVRAEQPFHIPFFTKSGNSAQ
jgi:ketosteroid isomerase-like protein